MSGSEASDQFKKIQKAAKNKFTLQNEAETSRKLIESDSDAVERGAVDESLFQNPA